MTSMERHAAATWIADSDANACHSCSAALTQLKRKHHCRKCGLVFCDACTKDRMMLLPSWGIRDPVRVCAPCGSELRPHQPEYAEANANCHRTNRLEDDAVRGKFPGVVRAHANNPFTMTLGSAIRNATFTLKQQENPLLIPDHKIPMALLQKAEGFVFVTFLRVGIFGGVKIGSGLAVVKREDGSWSAPSAVGMGGAFIGVTFGADVVNMCLVITKKEVSQQLLSKGQLNFEGEVGASIGPIGRNASIGAVGRNGFAPVYTYCQSKGLLIGVDVNGSYLFTRDRVNHKFYGVRHTAEEILTGDVPQPEAGYVLYETILQLTNTREYQKAKKDHQEKMASIAADSATADLPDNTPDQLEGPELGNRVEYE